MSSNLNGFKNETLLINYLNNKTLKELNDNMQKFIKFLFPNIKENEKIFTHKGIFGQKPDMVINIGEISKRISVKIGSGNSIHQESIDLFMSFLTKLNISENTKLELLKFHWADGSNDGTGAIRISSSEYKQKNKNQVKLINDELNKKENLLPLVERLIFKGKNSNYEEVDLIYYGNINSGHWASKEEIINYILSKSFKSDSIHLGPLNYQVWNRCLNRNPNTENRRNIMQAKWASILNDLINIEKERDNNE